MKIYMMETREASQIVSTAGDVLWDSRKDGDNMLGAFKSLLSQGHEKADLDAEDASWEVSSAQ